MQTRNQGAGRALLKIAQVQFQQMTEYLAAQHRVDAVARVQNKILPQPGQKCIEKQEDHQAHRDGDQRALGLMHDHFVDDDLCEQRRGQADELQHQRGNQHITPDGFVFKQLRQKPAEAEFVGVV